MSFLHEDPEWPELLDIVATADFARNYEDSAQIIAQRARLPRLEPDLSAVVKLLDQEDGKRMPPAAHPAFNPDSSARWHELEVAWAAIGPMYWGRRLPLGDATRTLRSFLDEVAET